MKFNFKPTKKIAPMFLSFLVFGTYCLGIVLFILAIVKKNPLFLQGILFIVILDLCLNYGLAWYTFEDVQLLGDEIKCIVHTNVDVLGTDYTSYKAKFAEISHLNISGNKVTLEGKIMCKEPKFKPKEVNKFVILDVTEDFIKELKEKVNCQS